MDRLGTTQAQNVGSNKPRNGFTRVKINLLNDYEHPLKLLNAVAVNLIDPAIAPTDKNLIAIATKIISAAFVNKEPVEPRLHEALAMLFLLASSEPERAEILAQCDFLKAGGKHD